MKKSYTDTDNILFSPLGFTITILFSYMGLFFLFIELGNKLPLWVWISGIPIAGLGATLEIFSRRLLLIRLYQLFISLLIVAPCLFYLLLILTKNSLGISQVFTVIIFVLIISGIVIATNRIATKQVNPTEMPHGPSGLLNPKTGLVDPTRSPKQVQKNQQKSLRMGEQLVFLTPLFAGIAMFLVQVLGDQEIDLLLAISAMLILCLGIGGSIGYGRHVLSIRRWEQQYGKQIHVQR